MSRRSKLELTVMRGGAPRQSRNGSTVVPIVDDVDDDLPEHDTIPIRHERGIWRQQSLPGIIKLDCYTSDGRLMRVVEQAIETVATRDMERQLLLEMEEWLDRIDPVAKIQRLK